MPAVSASRYMTPAGWDDVPHLDPAEKERLLASTLPYLRDARSKGLPTMGADGVPAPPAPVAGSALPAPSPSGTGSP